MTSLGEGKTAIMVAASFRTVSTKQLIQTDQIHTLSAQELHGRQKVMQEPVISLYKEESPRATLLGPPCRP